MSGTLGQLAPEKVVAALVNDGVPVLGLRRAAAQPGGPVRLAHRGGLRCQRLTWHRRCRPGAPTSGPGGHPGAARSPCGLGAAVPALGAAADLRSPAQPGRPGRPRRRAGDHGHRGEDVAAGSAGRRTGLPLLDHRQRPVRGARGARRRAARCSCRSPWRAIAGDSVAGEANIGTLRYLLAVPVDRTRLLAVKYARDRGLLGRRDAAGGGGRLGRRGGHCSAAAT